MSQKIIKIHLLLILDSFMAMYYVLWHTNRKGLPVVFFYAFTGIFKIIFEPTAEASGHFGQYFAEMTSGGHLEF